MNEPQRGIWTDTGETVTATHCGHPCPVQHAINDREEIVTRTDTYPDPNAEPFQYDAPQLCYACYVQAMERGHLMTFSQMTRAFQGK